jgi:hypothetical protein
LFTTIDRRLTHIFRKPLKQASEKYTDQSPPTPQPEMGVYSHLKFYFTCYIISSWGFLRVGGTLVEVVGGEGMEVLPESASLPV